MLDNVLYYGSLFFSLTVGVVLALAMLRVPILQNLLLYHNWAVSASLLFFIVTSMYSLYETVMATMSCTENKSCFLTSQGDGIKALLAAGGALALIGYGVYYSMLSQVPNQMQY